MNQVRKASFVLGLMLVGAASAHAQTFTEAFDGGDGVSGSAFGVDGDFIVTFSPAANTPNTPSGQTGFVGHVGGDGFAQLGGESKMLLQFTLQDAVASFSLSFYASSLLKLNETQRSVPVVTLSNNFGTQIISGEDFIALNTANPGTNGAGPTQGTFYTFTFAAPVSHPTMVLGASATNAAITPWSAGNYVMTFDNSPNAPGMRVDDITLTAVAAVPEPFTVALALAGLGIVTIGARASRKV